MGSPMTMKVTNDATHGNHFENLKLGAYNAQLAEGMVKRSSGTGELPVRKIITHVLQVINGIF